MRIFTIIGGNLESNGYIIYNSVGGEGFVIDPGYNATKFANKIEELKLNIKGILLTHHHNDHTGAVDKLSAMLSCPIYLHGEELDMYKSRVDILLEDGMKLSLDGEEIQVLHTPGHTKGSVCFLSNKSKLVFTGDTIFNVDLGRTDLKDGSEREMISSIKNVINLWGNDITIYPGHGEFCSMKYVRKNNKEFLDIIG
ncbi:MAG: MBL fold metallo-hydrolase [Aminipila sp.]